MPKRRYRKPGDPRDLRLILWTVIRDLEDWLYHDPPLAIEDLVRVAHVLSQLSGAYLKAVDLDAMNARLTAVEQTLSTHGQHR
jgi:hypothetical protein